MTDENPDQDELKKNHFERLLEENRRLAQRCLELESASRRQMEKLQVVNQTLTRGDSDLRLLLENAAIGFALTDLNFRVATANRTLADMLGYMPSELAGVNFANFVYVGKLPVFTRIATGQETDNGTLDAIIELVTRSGSLLPCRVAASNWLDENGASKGHFLLVFDAGPELTAAGRLREMEQALAETEKSRQLFLEVVGRELRTPASGVVGMSRMLIDSGIGGRERELVNVIHSSASSLVRMVDDLIDVANLDAGRVRFEPVAVSPSDLASGVANLFSVRAEEKGIDLRVHTSPNVPDPILADPHLLRRVLAHLLDNAVKFTERGHVSLVVDVLDSRIRFMVSDTGPGITPEAESAIFESAFAPDNAVTRRHGGIGVGLTICRRLVAAMGGRMSHESEPGRGSEFHFVIPLERPEPNSETRRIEAPVEAIHLPTMTVLLADANPVSSGVLRAYLRFENHRLTVTDNGVDAAEKCRTGHYDVAILDLDLPKLDGIEALRIIREDERDRPGRRIPVILIATQGRLRQPEYYKRAGADGVVTKPIHPVDLMRAVAKATGATPLSVAKAEAPGDYQAGSRRSSIRRIDGSHLVNIKQVMRDEQFVGLLRFFLEDAIPALEQLKSDIDGARSDVASLSFAAIKMRGLAGYLGLSALASLLERLEKAIVNHAPAADVMRYAAELPIVTNDSIEELRRIFPEAFGQMPKKSRDTRAFIRPD